MEPSKRTARLAGVLYLSTAVTAPFSLIYVPRTLIVPGDAAATAEKLLAHDAVPLGRRGGPDRGLPDRRGAAAPAPAER
jgi:hypothetical protein